MQSQKGGIITAVLLIGAVLLGSVGFYTGIQKQSVWYQEKIQKQQEEMAALGAFNPAGGKTYRTQTSIGSTDTSIRLSSFKNRSDIPLTMTVLNTDIGYGTLSPQTTRSEFVSFTGVTQNADGTATLTGVSRGLSDVYPFTASSTLREAHPGQSVFILSDSPQLFEEYAKTRSDMAVTGTWSFNTNLPTSSLTATTSGQFVTKGLLDTTTNQGAATSTETNGGIVELGTLAEQADSYDGGVSKPTVLQTKNSTSTCQVVGSYNIVASSTTGKLDKNCFDQTASYIWTGSHIFNSASTTVVNLNTTNATTTNATTTNLYVSGTLDYTPFTTLVASSPVVLLNSGAPDSTTSHATTTLTIAAGTMGANSSLDIYGTAERGVSGLFGYTIEIGTGTASTTLYTHPIASDANYKFNLRLFNLNSLSSQKAAGSSSSSADGYLPTVTTVASSINTANQFYIAIGGHTAGGETITWYGKRIILYK